MRFFRNKKPLPCKPDTGVNGQTGYITVSMTDGDHDLLNQAVVFMIRQEERHMELMDSMEFRTHLEERVLDLHNIYENEMYSRLTKFYGEDGILRHDIALTRIGTDGWSEPWGKKPDRYRTEIWADGVDVEGNLVHMKGYIYQESGYVSLLQFPKIWVNEKLLACTLYICFDDKGNITACSLAYGKFTLVLSNRSSKLYHYATDAFVSRFKALRKNLPPILLPEKGKRFVYAKSCIPFSIDERDFLQAQNNQQFTKMSFLLKNRKQEAN